MKLGLNLTLFLFGLVLFGLYNRNAHTKKEIVSDQGASSTSINPMQRSEDEKVVANLSPQKPHAKVFEGMGAIHSRQVERGLEKLPERLHYKIDDGFGVAFGDTLIGQPKENAAPSGSTNVPMTSAWHSRKIAFFIRSELPAPDRVLQAIQYFNENTLIQFIPFSGEADAIVFEPGTGCKSYVGRIGGHQPILLAPGCQTHEVIHEIMHALGFIHEQSRTDRDKYIKVVRENIDPDHLIDFDIVPQSYMDLVPFASFDYKSIMMYPPTIFARVPGASTMESITNESIQPSSGLSAGDLERLRLLFP